MAKIKVHELAKELELQSKDILNFLQEKGIEAKAAQSSLEEDAAALVRNSLGKKKAAAPAAQKAPVNTENAKPAEEKAQAPAGEAKAQETKVSEETKSTEETKKKKKIIFVSNPQNSKMPGQRQGVQSGQGQRNAGDSVRIRAADTRTMVTRIIPTATVFRHRLPYVPSSR